MSTATSLSPLQVVELRWIPPCPSPSTVRFHLHKRALLFISITAVPVPNSLPLCLTITAASLPLFLSLDVILPPCDPLSHLLQPLVTLWNPLKWLNIAHQQLFQPCFPDPSQEPSLADHESTSSPYMRTGLRKPGDSRPPQNKPCASLSVSAHGLRSSSLLNVLPFSLCLLKALLSQSSAQKLPPTWSSIPSWCRFPLLWIPAPSTFFDICQSLPCDAVPCKLI